MEKYDLIEKLQSEMLKTKCDAKAEHHLSMAIEKGLSLEDFMVSCDSLFFREYNKDVLFTEIRDDARKHSILLLHLTRSGIYDHLPEGLFFQPAQVPSRNSGATEMAHDHRINNQKEQEIRHFFLPFENEFFTQRIQLESEETRLLEGLRSGILNDYFTNFWGIPRSIPKTFIVPLILLLPYANKIAGDLTYTADCLEALLDETVRVNKIEAPVTHIHPLFQGRLGNQDLGVDMVCGHQFYEDYPVLDFVIGPLKNSAISDYLDGGERFTFLQTFYRFFIPAGVDLTTSIEVAAEKRFMHLEQENSPVLGYSTFLQLNNSGH